MKIVTGPRKEFVLVVDSDRHRGRSLVSELRSFGCYVSLASSGAEALKYVEENEPDSVVSDWNLEDMTGLELTRRIKSTRFETRVVLEKADGDWRSLRETLEVGGDELLSRPHSAAAVLRNQEQSTPRRIPRPPGSPTRIHGARTLATVTPV